MNFIHTPTGKSCTVIAKRKGGSLCNFGDTANPFTWVNDDELTPVANAKLPDFTYVDHGTIIILTPKTPEGKAWAKAFEPFEQMAGWGKDGIAIHHRDFSNVVDAIDGDGLTFCPGA